MREDTDPEVLKELIGHAILKMNEMEAQLAELLRRVRNLERDRGAAR
jgi:hypothetical protein